MSLLTQLSSELESLVGKASPAVVGVEQRKGHGTGFVLASDGYVLTNSHVVREPKDLKIRLARGAEVRGELVGLDQRTDLAVIRADTQGLPSLALADSRNIKVGQLVVAIGNPLWFERSVSLGVVSALERNLPSPNGLLEGLIQTDAAINPGNSGGPLLSSEGEVVGINTAIIPYANGIGFAVPSRTASWVTAVLMQKGEVQRPFIGIAASGEELPPLVSRDAGQPRGVRVLKVGIDTPASQAGLRDGDLLLSANGNPVGSIDDLQRVMVLASPTELRLDVLRGQRREALSIRPRPALRAAA